MGGSDAEIFYCQRQPFFGWGLSLCHIDRMLNNQPRRKKVRFSMLIFPASIFEKVQHIVTRLSRTSPEAGDNYFIHYMSCCSITFKDVLRLKWLNPITALIGVRIHVLILATKEDFGFQWFPTVRFALSNSFGSFLVLFRSRSDYRFKRDAVFQRKFLIGF